MRKIVTSLYNITADVPSLNINGSIKFDDYNVLHNHDYFEVFIVKNGIYHHYLNDTDSILNQGEGFLLRTTDVHRLESVSRSVEHLNIMFKYDFFIKACSEYADGLYEMISKSTCAKIRLSSNDMDDIISNINRYYNENDSLKSAILEKLIINKIIESIIKEANIVNSKLPEWLDELLKDIDKEENIKCTASDFIKRTKYSQTHIERMFKEHMGITLAKYIQNARLGYAAKYILYSDKTINEISNILGYSDVSHFNHIFKNKYNMSPLQYKKAFNREGYYK